MRRLLGVNFTQVLLLVIANVQYSIVFRVPQYSYIAVINPVAIMQMNLRFTVKILHIAAYYTKIWQSNVIFYQKCYLPRLEHVTMSQCMKDNFYTYFNDVSCYKHLL